MSTGLGPKPKVLRIYASQRVTIEFPYRLDSRKPSGVFLNLKEYIDLDADDITALGDSLNALVVNGRITVQQIGYVYDASEIGTVDQNGNPTDLQTLLGTFAGAPDVFGSEAAPLLLDGVSVPIVLRPRHSVAFVRGNTGPVVYAGLPLAGLFVGQTIDWVGQSDVDTVSFQNGSQLSTNGAPVLSQDKIWTVIWSGSKWIDRSRNA